MKILIDIGHPAHVHLFKNFIWVMKKRGHEILVTARDKDVSLYLLRKYSINFLNRGKGHIGIIGKSFGMLLTDYKIYKIAKRFKPDILIGGTGNVYIAETAFLLGKPSVVFDDTEHSFFETNLLKMFASVICTPSCYLKDLGKKQVRYNGYQELAYLHPKYFKPNKEVFKELGVKKREKFFIIRLVSWKALHDIFQKGFDYKTLSELIHLLQKHGRIFISSEGKMPRKFERYRFSIPPEKMHNALYFATMYIGEGGTMATEAALLGTPSLHVSTSGKLCGVYEELEKRYGLVHVVDDNKKIINIVKDLLERKKS